MTMKQISGWTAKKSFLSLTFLLVALALAGATWIKVRQTQPDATTKARFKEMYGQLPLSFEANAGQFAPQVDFISRGSGYTLLLTPREAVLALRAAPSTTNDARPDHASAASAVLRMK